MRWLFYPVMAVLCVACSNVDESGAVREADWYPLSNAYARCFRILVRGDERQLVVLGPGGATDTLAVYHVHGGGDTSRNVSGAKQLPVLDRVAVVSTTHLSFISALGRASAVVGAAHLADVRDTTMRARIRHGTVQEIGTADGLDQEQLIALAPQALLDYPFGRANSSRGHTGPARIEVTEYLEQDPLGRAEWIRFFGVLFGQEVKADSIFKAIELRYVTVRDMAKVIPQHPKVFFGSAWQGQWFVPPGNSYIGQLITDAGGAYCYADQKADGNITIDLETVLAQARSAQHFGVVLASAGRVGLADLSAGDKRIETLDAVKRGGFYLDSQRSDVFGAALLEPDQLLLDMRCIFHQQYCAGRQPQYAFALGQ